MLEEMNRKVKLVIKNGILETEYEGVVVPGNDKVWGVTVGVAEERWRKRSLEERSKK